MKSTISIHKTKTALKTGSDSPKKYSNYLIFQLPFFRVFCAAFSESPGRFHLTTDVLKLQRRGMKLSGDALQKPPLCLALPWIVQDRDAVKVGFSLGH